MIFIINYKKILKWNFIFFLEKIVKLHNVFNFLYLMEYALVMKFFIPIVF